MSGDMYTDAIMALAHKHCGHGHLEKPRAQITLDNPLCGDRVTMDINWRDTGLIVEVAHEVRGCALCLAAASLIGGGAPGRTVSDVAQATGDLSQILYGTRKEPPRSWPELAVFTPVRHHKSRFNCVLLPFQALLNGSGSVNT